MGITGIKSVLIITMMMMMVGVKISECKAFGLFNPYPQSPSETDQIFQQTYDVVTGKRDVKFEGNIYDGTARVTTSYTNEEIMTMVAIGGGILLLLACCGVCCKHCCCASKPSTVILYQQMPGSTPLQPRFNHSVMPGVHSVIPMRNQGFSEMQCHTVDASPPPPYPGIVTH